MNFAFYLFRLFSSLISALPFRLIYFLSDLLALFLKYIIRYRKQVIQTNLINAFPEKSDAEINSIISGYYRNLADIIFEVIKLQRIRPEELKSRFEFLNHHLLSTPLSKGKSVILAIGHCGNWEWMGTALGLITDQKGFALTKPLTDKNFNHYMEMLRHRLNPDSTLPFKSAFREMVKRKDTASFYVIAADQTPTRDEANFWVTFMNQDTPFFTGIEKIAQAFDAPVLFVDIRRTARGRYRGEIKTITDTPRSTAEGEISSHYVKLLEAAVRETPSNWLWSHRRWKHKKPRQE
jgi:KDO2-lipid IV(A) lauroyltransferase